MRAFKTGVIITAVIVAAVALGPVIGRTVGVDLPLAAPLAYVKMKATSSKLIVVTADERHFLGEKGPTERDLTDYLEARGWELREITHYPVRAAHPGNPVAEPGRTEIGFERNGDTLNVMGRFRLGVWWFELDRTP